MEKILLAVNANQLNKETIDFACYIARLTGSSLSAMLLEGLPGPGVQEQPLPQSSSCQVSFSGSGAMAGVSGGVVTLSPETKATMHEQATEHATDPAHFFRDACAAQNVKSYIYRNRHMPLYEIVAETRFADLLITDADISFEAVKEPSPTLFVRTLLAEAECPVIVAPRNFDRVDEIVFAYDGSASSVFAIKQFTYLFPGLDNRTATLLHVREHGDWTAEEKRRIGDWLKPHYSVINFRLLQGKARDELFGYLLGRENVFVVMGAFGRNMLSRVFRGSSAGPILRATDLPVFITHY